MVKIKYLILCLISLLGLTSCHHDDNKLYQLLPIVKEFEPEYYIFDGDEISKEEWVEVQSWFQKYLKMKMWFLDGPTDTF